jgi:hypothetical protein
MKSNYSLQKRAGFYWVFVFIAWQQQNTCIRQRTIGSAVPVFDAQQSPTPAFALLPRWVDEVLLHDSHSTERLIKVARQLLPAIRVIAPDAEQANAAHKLQPEPVPAGLSVVPSSRSARIPPAYLLLPRNSGQVGQSTYHVVAEDRPGTLLLRAEVKAP